MELNNKYFLAIYTNEVKDYAVEKFFKNLSRFTHGGVVDNSSNSSYYEKLKHYTSLPVTHIRIPYKPRLTLFHRNVVESVGFLRQRFLETNMQYFLILESDVITGPHFLEDLDGAVELLNARDANWGALGCLYYAGFHNYEKTGLNKTHHVLSGATVYKRKAIAKYPFRWSIDNLRPFPDEWWSIDAGKEYGLWNAHDIRLEHLHHTDGSRYSKAL